MLFYTHWERIIKMNTEKKWFDKDVATTLSNFVHGSPIIQCTNDAIHKEIDSILKQQLEHLYEEKRKGRMMATNSSDESAGTVGTPITMGKDNGNE